MPMSIRALPFGAVLLAACETTTIQFPDTAPPSDTATDTGGDTGPDSDTDTALPAGDPPFTGIIPTTDATAVLVAESTSDGVGYGGGLDLGDVTGDGHADLLVGARMAAGEAGASQGRVYVVSDVPEGTNPLSVADTILVGDTLGRQFGTSVTGSADVDGDGVLDLVVGGPGGDDGGVYVFRGPLAAGEIDASAADTVLVGEADFSYTGIVVRPAGDMNGDGDDDLVIGSYYSDDDCPGCGTVYVSLSAGVDGISLVGDDAVRIHGDRERGQIGSGLAEGLDLDGDGWSDLAIGAPASAAGGVALLYGPFRSGSFELGDADAWFAGDTPGSSAGVAVTGGDLDGDGYDELVVGAPYSSENGQMSGKVLVQFGGAARLDGEFELGGEATLLGEANDYAGTAVTNAGDLDGDGTEDLLVGAPYASRGAQMSGAAYLAYGPLTRGDHLLVDFDAEFAGTRSSGYLGLSVTGSGDLDGDGGADLAIGAMNVADPYLAGLYVFFSE